MMLQGLIGMTISSSKQCPAAVTMRELREALLRPTIPRKRQFQALRLDGLVLTATVPYMRHILTGWR